MSDGDSDANSGSDANRSSNPNRGSDANSGSDANRSSNPNRGSDAHRRSDSDSGSDATRHSDADSDANSNRTSESLPERLLADLRWKLRHNPLQVVGFVLLVVVGFEYIRLFYPGLDPTLGSLGRGLLIILGVVLLRARTIRGRL